MKRYLPTEPAGCNSPAGRAFDRALKLLEHRGLSKQELTRRLAVKGFDVSEAEEAARRLEEVGILNDASLAEDLVLQATRKGYGTGRIAQTLGQRGLALPDGHEDVRPEEELETLLELAQKRAATYRNLPPDAALRRLAGYLLRRGFEAETVRRACEQVLGKPSGSD